jgi:mRNA-degrading endonuclease RelE of RelBE toxin-antitoxin system
LISRTTSDFRDRLRKLPHDVQRAARASYVLFRDNPSHPALHFKPIKGLAGVYSARISLGYRTLGRIDGETIVWFWIGSHAEYDRILRG